MEESVKIGGLAATKVARIRAILETVLSERPHECLDGTRGHESVCVQGLGIYEECCGDLLLLGTQR